MRNIFPVFLSSQKHSLKYGETHENCGNTCMQHFLSLKILYLEAALYLVYLIQTAELMQLMSAVCASSVLSVYSLFFLTAILSIIVELTFLKEISRGLLQLHHQRNTIY